MKKILSLVTPKYEISTSIIAVGVSVFFAFFALCANILSNSLGIEIYSPSQTFVLISLIVLFVGFYNRISILLIPVSLYTLMFTFNQIKVAIFLKTPSLSNISLFFEFLFVVCYIISLYKKINNKILKCVSILFLLSNSIPLIINVITGYINIESDYRTASIKFFNSFQVLCYIIVLFLIFNFSKHKENCKESYDLRQIICIGLAIVIFIIGFGGRLGTVIKKDSCGHESCKENGPFPCCGKNNTCSNTTSCYKDLYCDDCK